MLLGRHVAGTLSPAEADRLMKLALEDQTVFDELVAFENLRNALQDPSFRAVIKADLRARVQQDDRSWWGRLWRPLLLPAVAVAVLAVGFFMSRPKSGSGTVAEFTVELGNTQAPALRVATLMEKRPGEPDRLDPPARAANLLPAEGSVGFDRPGETPVYRLGDPMRMGFRIVQDAAVVVVEQRADGSTFRLFPNQFQASARVAGGSTIWIPPAGQGPLIVEGPAGVRVVQVLVFRADVDPLNFQTPWAVMRERARVLTKRYQVQP